MHFRSSRGIDVILHRGTTAPTGDAAIEVDVGNALPVAFSGLRRLLAELRRAEPELFDAVAAGAPTEMSYLFPRTRSDVDGLFHLADAPNQRRLFRESEQVYRVLHAAAHVMQSVLAETGRPLVLAHVGACDLPSLRGIMHAVESSRLCGVESVVHMTGTDATSRLAPPSFRTARARQLERLFERMRARHASDSGMASSYDAIRPEDACLESRYLHVVVDEEANAEARLAAALLALRTTFFSTSYEGAHLAASTGLELLRRSGGHVDAAALLRAWEELDDPLFAVPMVEIDRSSLETPEDLPALFLLHQAVVQSFCFESDAALATLDGALRGRISNEMRSDLHMHRGVLLTKRIGNVAAAQAEIELGLRALGGEQTDGARVREAWLRNLYALTHFQAGNLRASEDEEARAIAAIDDVPGDSATHLKTNLISNFSVLYEAKDDFDTAIGIWRGFEALNEKVGSARADKVYRNRLGALLHRRGDHAGAVSNLGRAHDLAEVAGDHFHAETIAANLGRIHLESGESGHAEEWYGRAAESAWRSGDPLQLASDLAGSVLARGGATFERSREALSCNSTYDLTKNRLPSAVRADDAALVRAALAATKTKLSRPFDLVNL